MKYLPVKDFDVVTSALNFNTPDCNVTGGCDLYTTKSTGSDKKLYKSIDKDLNSQHAALLKLGASLSPPDREAMLASSPSAHLFSHSSAFGPLSELSSRRTFAYLIATLNASHPHYDFSHALRPGDFKRERNLRRVMGNLDSILQNVRGRSAGASGSFYHGSRGEGRSLGYSLSSLSASGGMDSRANDYDFASDGIGASGAVWGPHCWARIDNEMRLEECTLFSYHPEIDPFEEEESAIYAVHYFFFHRALKRVAYLYLRVVPVISAQSPPLRPSLASGTWPEGQKRKRRGESSALDDYDASASTSSKRARYWLGDRDAELVAPYDDDDEPDDGLTWNRDEDGEILREEDEYAYGYDDYDEEDEVEGVEGVEAEEESDNEEDGEEETSEQGSQSDKSPVRNMSEDVVASMDL